MVAGDIRRSNDLIPYSIDAEKLKIVCERTKYPRDACLIALLYLTGRRIGEIICLRLRDLDLRALETEGIFIVTCMNEKVWLREKSKTFKIPVEGDYFDKEKNEKYNLRYYEEIQPRFNINSPSGKILSPFILDYLWNIQNLDENNYLFPPYKRGHNHITTQHAWRIIKTVEPSLWCHALRHLMITAFWNASGRNPKTLHEYTFHKRVESTMDYIKAVEVSEVLKKV